MGTSLIPNARPNRRALLAGLAQFFDKQAFAADFGEGFVENLVAARGHAENLHIAFGIEGLQARLNVLGLP